MDTCFKERIMFAPPVIFKCKNCGSKYWDNELKDLHCPTCGGDEMQCLTGSKDANVHNAKTA